MQAHVCMYIVLFLPITARNKKSRQKRKRWLNNIPSFIPYCLYIDDKALVSNLKKTVNNIKDVASNTK